LGGGLGGKILGGGGGGGRLSKSIPLSIFPPCPVSLEMDGLPDPPEELSGLPEFVEVREL
jgi:hypothetical protein